MAKYIIDPDKLGGGYSDFRIVSYYHGVTPATEIYQILKKYYAEGKHVLIHIHRSDDDRGIHSHRHTVDNTFEVHDFNVAYGTEELMMEKWSFSSDKVSYKKKTIDLSKIAVLEEKLNQITIETNE